MNSAVEVVGDPIEISTRSLAAVNLSPWAIVPVRRCFRHPVVSFFDRTQTCDGRTDRRTHRHTTTPYTALA